MQDPRIVIYGRIKELSRKLETKEGKATSSVIVYLQDEVFLLPEAYIKMSTLWSRAEN